MDNSCDYKVQSKLTDVAKQRIIEQCWSIKFSHNEYLSQSQQFKYYFENYAGLSRNCSPYDIGRLEHEHILAAAQLAKTSPSFRECYSSLERFCDLRGVKYDECLLRQLLDFATKSLLLVDASEWMETGNSVDIKLHDFLNNQFPISKQPDSFQVSSSFNARNLSRIGGFNIRWTDLISEHLMLEKEGRQLVVFHHSAILNTLEDSGFYPSKLFQEIRWTYSILFPKFDYKCRDWYRSHVSNPSKRAPGSSSSLDISVLETNNLQIAERNVQKANYFRDRLISLKDEYDNHRPQTFMQHLIDDRNPTRRWGFLITALVFFFGMVQTIEGAIQCYKAYHPTT